MQTRVDLVGNARAPVIVIENAWAEASDLIEQAVQRNDYGASSLYYPGIRSTAPPEYANAILASIKDLVRSTFGLADDPVISSSHFSLLTTPADKLVPFQRVPHFDSADQNTFALLHYLVGPERGGGTSFYRHRSTGLEIITAENQESYIRTVNDEVKATGMPPSQYVDGDTELFERTARYDAAFNRALIYRGNMLHSVNAPPDFVPDTDPRTGRLTVNTFLTVRTKKNL